MADYKWGKPAKKLSDDEAEEILKRARERIQDCYEHESENRKEAEIDLEFVAGNQWPEYAKQQRGTTRPMITINQLPQFVQQVVNPTRTSQIGIKVLPVDGGSDKQLANVYDGLIRQIEYQSDAKSAYIQAHEHQVKCGIGWLQICAEYASDEVFEKELFIKPIEHPLSVYSDPSAMGKDSLKASWRAVVENWPRSTFKERYPKVPEHGMDVPDGSSVATFNWASQDSIAVVMYFERIPAKKMLAMLEDGSTIDVTGKGEGELGQLDQQKGIKAVREVDSHKVKKYLLTGNAILEGPIDWPGTYIPVLPVIGTETPRKSGTMRSGIVRAARDPQQLLNFYETAAVETIALSPKAPYVVTPSMVGPHKEQWDNLNTQNYPYLLYTPDPEMPGVPPKREHPPETPAAAMQQVAGASEHMKRVTGIYDASLGQRSNETSGRAINAREQQGATANAHYTDNLILTLTQMGRVLVDLIPKIYDNERTIRIRQEDGKEEQVVINKILYEVDGVANITNDLSAGRFDVRVTVGQTALSQRMEAFTAMTELVKSVPPQFQTLMLDLMVKNSDWPGAEELVKRFRNMLPPQALVDPNDPNAPKPPNPMDDPMVKVGIAEKTSKIELEQAQMAKTAAETSKLLAEVNALTTQVSWPGMPPEPPKTLTKPPERGGSLEMLEEPAQPGPETSVSPPGSSIEPPAA